MRATGAVPILGQVHDCVSWGEKEGGRENETATAAPESQTAISTQVQPCRGFYFESVFLYYNFLYFVLVSCGIDIFVFVDL